MAEQKSLVPEAVTPDAAETSLAKPDARRTYLAKAVKPEVVEALTVAHNQFFGALTAQDLTIPEKTLLTAVAVRELKKALDGPVLDEIIVPLVNAPGGIPTDRDPRTGFRGEEYGRRTILYCTVDAWLHGFPMVGGMWQILANGMYGRKEGYEYLLRDLCRWTPSVKVPPISGELYSQGGYLKIAVTLLYRLHTEEDGSEPQRFNGVYDVRLTKNNKVAVENVTGKALRKAYKDLYARITGIHLQDEDAVEPTAEVGTHHVADHSSDAPTAADIKGESPVKLTEAQGYLRHEIEQKNIKPNQAAEWLQGHKLLVEDQDPALPLWEILRDDVELDQVKDALSGPTE